VRFINAPRIYYHLHFKLCTSNNTNILEKIFYFLRNRSTRLTNILISGIVTEQSPHMVWKDPMGLNLAMMDVEQPSPFIMRVCVTKGCPMHIVTVQ
jgi:hypothetical protein